MSKNKREELKTYLLVRDKFCIVCGRPLIPDYNIDMHEGIVSRAEIMGLPPKIKERFYNEYNCILICHYCNVNNPPSRKKVWDYLEEIYGKEKLSREYEIMIANFKSRRQRFD